MPLAWYVQDVLASGALTVDGRVGFTGHSVLRPCLESPVTRRTFPSGAWPRCQIPGKFSRATKFFFFILAEVSGKKTEDMSWKARWTVAPVRAEAAIKPSVQPSTCPRAAFGSGISISDWGVNKLYMSMTSSTQGEALKNRESQCREQGRRLLELTFGLCECGYVCDNQCIS